MSRIFTPRTILVTGGAGFIGSNFIRYLFKNIEFRGCVVNLDSLTYAGNVMNLDDLNHEYGGERYFFERADVSNRTAVETIFQKYNPDCVVHFAAESHVDRSILGPSTFIQTNLIGTFTLIDVARIFWGERQDVLFHHVSTDEVYGSLGKTGYFTEKTPYDPHSPYSASKAGSDHLVSAYFHTYNVPVTISNCSNNYGPYQFPEKLIPLMIINMIEGKPLPVYGKGENVRDWIYVEDHCAGIWATITKADRGDRYNFGGKSERTNIQLVSELAELIAEQTSIDVDSILQTITYVSDRPGHDFRYAIDSSYAEEKLQWKAKYSLSVGLAKTVSWYIEHRSWIQSIITEEYKNWNDVNYRNRKYD